MKPDSLFSKSAALLEHNSLGSLSDNSDIGMVDPVQFTILQQHFDQHIYNHYGRIVVVNLLNQYGMEHPLGRAFAFATLKLNQKEVKYV
ncbi:unnamed protein product [Protopolystoma xenopodis]|uniref:SAC domain-containing protein n=1 Tax=Protopolystoma xenopodis TaxID=117903 RepID=A0A3S5BSV3_9PLAT|nr:unnamed protein product [Protopolystoma xenopodis]